MTTIRNSKRLIFVIIAPAVLFSCKNNDKHNDLGDIDVSGSGVKTEKVFIKPKTDADIRNAYKEYLKSADIDDRARASALSRLAQLELSNSEKLNSVEDAAKSSADKDFDKRYDEQIESTIKLLKTSLLDYPKAKNNDSILYQLAKAYAQKGDQNDSIESLNKLVNDYPQSEFYAEAQFRIAEDDFSRKKYSDAEYAYTEVIVSQQNDIFYEKALFKRGWSRFKQEYYSDAIDDFLDAISSHEFNTYEKLSKSELELFDEYFRSVALSFSYLGGADSLHTYFTKHPDFKYIYFTYSKVADIYLKEERYTDAAETFQQFVKYYPDSEDLPYAHLKIIEAWQKSGFDTKVYEAIEHFFTKYNPSSNYWVNQNENSNVNRVIRRELKKYVILMAGYYHNKYQKSHRNDDFGKASAWYNRYLKYYSTYAQSDNIYFLYAELLSQNKQYKSALEYYEKAAYQNDLIVNKDAAYASIITTDRLYQMTPDNKDYLTKDITYSLKYAQTYPNDQHTLEISKHAAEVAFKAKEYKSSIQLCDIILSQTKSKPDIYVSGLKAESYFNLGEYNEAEHLYSDIVNNLAVTDVDKTKYRDKLALSIYKQGESAVNNKDVATAVKHYSRISVVAPQSEIASTGLYDAIAIDMQYKQWQEAITLIKRYQQLYPDSKNNVDIAKKLSAAYLYSDQGIQAAKEFEKLSSIGNDAEVKAAALWRAAELYEKKNETNDAIRAYEQYAKQYQKPFPQYMESMYKLTQLYSQTKSENKVDEWCHRIIEADQKALNNAMNDRTKYISSEAYLKLANNEKIRFDSIKLTLPLVTSLKKKKDAMQNAVNYYGKASKYKIFDVVTEATNSIATIYKSFSKSLLDSDRPKNLNEEELNQYEILLEDQAFPFEDKAIQFYEINLARIKDGNYNKWIDISHNHLIELFPTRYKREPKQDDYINEDEYATATADK